MAELNEVLYEVVKCTTGEAVATFKRECDAIDMVTRTNDRESDFVLDYRILRPNVRDTWR